MNKQSNILLIACVFLGVAIGIGSVNLFQGVRVAEKADALGFSPKSNDQPSPRFSKTKDLDDYDDEYVNRPSQTCNCADKRDFQLVIQATKKLAKQIDDFPHGITEKGLSSAVQKAFDKRPCITYKELSKHFVPSEDEINFED